MAAQGYPGLICGATTGYVNLGAIQKLRLNAAGFPGVLVGSTGYINLGAAWKDPDAGPLTGGVLSESSNTTTAETLAWTSATGGSSPYTAQLQQSAVGANSWSNVGGATSSPATVSGLSPSTQYDFRVAYTDAASTVAYSNTLTVTTDSTGTLTITTPKSFQVLQMNGSSQASIAIVGTYTGSPTTIESRWNGGSWSTLDAAPAGGNFTGTMANQSAGQGTLQVRFSNETGLTASANSVGIGHIYLCAGQSNMSGRGTNSQVYSHATLKACLYGNDYVWKELADPYDSSTSQTDTVSSDTATGSLIPLLATLLMANYGVPVAFVPCAKGGSAITSWLPGANHQDRTTLYGSMVYRGLQTGAKLVLWWQGEQDALAGMSQATYNGHLDTLANAIFVDLGIKILPCLLQDCTDGSISPGLPAIRLATAEAWGDNSHVMIGPDLSDQTTDDGAHLMTDAKLLIAAQRYSAAEHPVIGSFSKTLGSVSLSAVGTVKVSGTTTKTLGGLTSSAVGHVNIAGTFSKTLGNITLTASGASSAVITGTLNKTLGAMTLFSGSGSITGSFNKTLGGMSLRGLGYLSRIQPTRPTTPTVPESLGSFPFDNLSFPSEFPFDNLRQP